MGTILKNYSNIRDFYRTLDPSFSINKKNEDTLEYAKENFMEDTKFEEYINKNTKNGTKFKYPTDERFKELTPFYETVNNKYINFTSTTQDSIVQLACGKDNEYLKDLIDLLFKSEEGYNKFRYNFNVIRPLRTNEEKHGTISKNISRNRDEYEKTQILEATLVQTIQGFCDIRKGDV